MRGLAWTQGSWLPRHPRRRYHSYMGRRLPLLLTAMLLAAGAALLLPPDSTAGDPGLVQRSPAREAADRTAPLPVGGAAPAAGANRDPLQAAAAAAVLPADDRPLRVGVLLVAAAMRSLR